MGLQRNVQNERLEEKRYVSDHADNASNLSLDNDNRIDSDMCETFDNLYRRLQKKERRKIITVRGNFSKIDQVEIAKECSHSKLGQTTVFQE